MASPATAAIKPRANIQRKPVHVQRVPGLGKSPKSGLTSFRASTPAREGTPTARQSPARTATRCPAGCIDPIPVFQDDGDISCDKCGAVIEAFDQLVSETTFAEGPGGQVRAQGVSIGAGETHRSAGAFTSTGHAGSETTPTRVQAEKNAKITIGRLCNQLNIRSGEDEQALRLFGLAYARGFVRGRSLDDVALVCLYMTIRQATEQVAGVRRPKYGLMLIDFAERGDIDVFALGKVFVDLCKELFFIEGQGWQPVQGPNGLEARFTAPGPEVFVPRFVDELEFPPNAALKIKKDAYKIIASMKRDWITRGRRPAGICGAAVIIAARMNNFRRSVREVVLVAKVTEITLNKRLEEFSYTPLSRATVSDFRTQQLPNVDYEDLQGKPDLMVLKERQAKQGLFSNLPNACDPPVMRPKPKKRRRKDISGADSAAIIEGVGGEDANEDAWTNHADGGSVGAIDNDPEQPPPKQARIDAEGFAVPTHPASLSSSTTASAPKRGRGRPKGSKNWRAPEASARERALEQEIQNDIDESMPEMQETATRLAIDEVIAQEQQPATDIDSTASVIVDPKLAGNTGDISMSPTLQAYEFEDDLDVSSCVLNEEERVLKETLWVNENADWLRQDHAKRIRRQLKEDELREKGIDPAQFERNKKAQGRRRKDGSRMPGRHGDVSYLDDPEYDRATRSHPTPGTDRASVDFFRPGSASPSPISGQPRDAAAAVKRMLTQRPVFTTRLNYDAIDSIYGNPSTTTTRSVTPASRAASIVSDAPSDRGRSRSIGIAGSSNNGRQAKEDIAKTAAQKRSRIKAGLPEDTDRSDIIFGGIGGKNTGLQRSKGSLSAEKRQNQVRSSMARGTLSPSVDPRIPVSARARSRGSDQGQGTPGYEESVRSITASPTPPPSRTLQQRDNTMTSSRREAQSKNVSFAKSPTQRGPLEIASGGTTPRSVTGTMYQDTAGTEEVVEGEGSGLPYGERSLIREVAPPGTFIGDDEDDDDDEDGDDEEVDDEDDEDDDDNDEDEEEMDADVDPDDAFAGRLRSRSRY